MPEELNLALIILVEVSFVIFLYTVKLIIDTWNTKTGIQKHANTHTLRQRKIRKEKKGTQQKALLDNNNDGYKLEEK